MKSALKNVIAIAPIVIIRFVNLKKGVPVLGIMIILGIPIKTANAHTTALMTNRIK